MIPTVYDSFLTVNKVEKSGDENNIAKDNYMSPMYRNSVFPYWDYQDDYNPYDYWDNFLNSFLYDNQSFLFNNVGNQSSFCRGSNCFPRVDNSKTDLDKLNSGYDSSTGTRLAGIAKQHADGGIGNCLQYVREDLESLGLSKGGSGSLGSAACESADKLIKNRNFSQISVAKDDLSKLPAGCMVIFNNGNNSGLSGTYGHILVTDGKGNGISDHTENLSSSAKRYSNDYVVLFPTKKNVSINKVG